MQNIYIYIHILDYIVDGIHSWYTRFIFNKQKSENLFSKILTWALV